MCKILRIEDNIDIVEFYDFLDIKTPYLVIMFKNLGEILEKCIESFGLKDYILAKIIYFYPPIYYDERYSNANIDNSLKIELETNKYKYISNFYRLKHKLKYELDFYAEHGNLNMVKHMKNIGYNVDLKNSRAIRLASKNGHYDVVKFLYNDERNYSYYEAVECAVYNRNFLIVKFFYKKGYFFQTRDGFLTGGIYYDYGGREKDVINYSDSIIYLHKKGCDIKKYIDKFLGECCRYNLLSNIEYFHEYLSKEILVVARFYKRESICKFIENKLFGNYLKDPENDQADFDLFW